MLPHRSWCLTAWFEYKSEENCAWPFVVTRTELKYWKSVGATGWTTLYATVIETPVGGIYFEKNAVHLFSTFPQVWNSLRTAVVLHSHPPTPLLHECCGIFDWQWIREKVDIHTSASKFITLQGSSLVLITKANQVMKIAHLALWEKG